MNRSWIGSLFLIAAMAPLYAQPEDVFRARIRGGGGEWGKCTIEVEVDDVAEVAITGDVGRLRTLAGGRATWRRFECSAPMPPNPGDFRFSGVDGRGRQTLVRDPRNSRGTAVVRIEDPKGGREGYTFDIEWRGYAGGGGGSYGGGGGYDNGPRFDQGMAIRGCQDAVRDRAYRDYGYRDVDVRDAQFDAGRGREWITGTFEGRRGPGRELFSFSCSVDLRTGQIRNVDVVRRGGPGGGGGLAGNVVRDCQDAVADRLSRDGYRDPAFRGGEFDDRRGMVFGAVGARDRYGASEFNYSCTVDRGGRIGNVDLRRR